VLLLLLLLLRLIDLRDELIGLIGFGLGELEEGIMLTTGDLGDLGEGCGCA